MDVFDPHKLLTRVHLYTHSQSRFDSHLPSLIIMESWPSHCRGRHQHRLRYRGSLSSPFPLEKCWTTQTLRPLDLGTKGLPQAPSPSGQVPAASPPPRPQSVGKTSFIPKCLCIVCEGKDGLASERKGSEGVAGVMIDDVVCVCVWTVWTVSSLCVPGVQGCQRFSLREAGG